MELVNTTGIKEITLNNEELAVLYENPEYNSYNCINNQYLIVRNLKGEVVDYFKWFKDKYLRVVPKCINNGFTSKIQARNPEQVCAIDMLMDDNVTVKALTGVAGSGKSMLMINAALDLVKRGKFEKIVYVRNSVTVKDVPQIGAIPGGVFEKMENFYAGLADHIGDLMMFSNKIEFMHLGYMRGRDLKNCCLLLNEAENLTADHIEMLIARCAEGTQFFIDGDNCQIDSNVFVQSNGISTCIDVLSGDELFAHVEMNKCERGKTARLAQKFRDYKVINDKNKRR